MLTNKKLKQTWINSVKELMEELGASESTPEVQLDYAIVWNLETKAGVLQVTLFYPLHLVSEMSLFCRWLDASKAISKGISCNPVNGKWNFHFSSESKTRSEKEEAIQTAISQIKSSIQNYLL